MPATLKRTTTISAFACRLRYDEHETIINTTSAGKAKSEFFRRVSDCCPNLDYTDIRVRRIGAPVTDAGFRRNAIYRGIPFAHVGMRVKVGESTGHIVGHNSSANLDVLFHDGPYAGEVLNCHPNSEVTYYDEDGNKIAPEASR